MASDGLKVIYGGGMIGGMAPYDKVDYVNEALDILKAHKVTTIDTAQFYGPSEGVLGQIKAGQSFTIDTKWQSGPVPGWATKENIISSGKESIKALAVDQVDIFYLHGPDRTVPFEETLSGVQEIYKLGLFKRFGLSNFFADEVQQVYDIAKKNGWVLPTAYQGNYNPVARLQETLLFPTLRSLGISFYAYSPLAGGFLTKTAADITDGKGRFNDQMLNGMYKNMYAKPSYIAALASWEKIAADEGISRAELAYRWVKYNAPLKRSQGDGIIIGSSSNEQLKQTLAGIEKGPLSDKAVKAIDAIWEDIKDDAPYDNFNQSIQ